MKNVASIYSILEYFRKIHFVKKSRFSNFLYSFKSNKVQHDPVKTNIAKYSPTQSNIVQYCLLYTPKQSNKVQYSYTGL